MIYKLEIENFCSIKDRQVIDLSVAASLSDPDGRLEELYDGADRKAPKVVAIFGANASGKTTVLKALDLLTRFPRFSPMKADRAFEFDTFAATDTIGKPIKLAMELGGYVSLIPSEQDDSNSDSCAYRYELEFIPSPAGTGYIVGSENLYQRPLGAKRWRRLFERQGRDVKGPSDVTLFSLTGYSDIIDKVPQNASLIATLADFQHAPSQTLVVASNQVFSNLNWAGEANLDAQIVQYLSQVPAVLSSLNENLRHIDLGLESVRIEQFSHGPVAMFKHDGLSKDLPWNLESHGTKSFIKIFPLIGRALETGGIAIIDEFDSQLHPVLLSYLVEWFYSRSEKNPLGAQLWFTGHSASMLHDLTKEEILLCEKDQDGRTTAYGLTDIEGVTRSENFYSKYLSGIYGGVPEIG